MVQACMMHHCNDYCLRSPRPNALRECKAMAGKESEQDKGDTPGWELRPRHAFVVDRQGIRHLQMKRTQSKRCVQHSKTLLQSWRANCDIKLLVYDSDPSCPNAREIDNVVRYVVAYRGKKKKDSQSRKECHT